MKAITMILAITFLGVMSFANAGNFDGGVNPSEANYGGSVTIKNDTGTKYYVWFGSGSGWLNGSGATKTTSCKVGTKLYASTSNSSSSKKFVFEINSSMCGKTIKLSDYL